MTIAEGTIQDPQWVEKQLQTYNCSTVFICLTGTDELMTTLNIFSAIERVGCVKHIIYVSAAGDFRSPKWAGAKILSAHCAVKFIIEDILAKLDGVKYSIVGPSFFTSNDLRGRNSIVKAGLYPEPVGKIGASRVNVDDIADAVVKLVLDGGERWGGKKIDLGSRAYNVSLSYHVSPLSLFVSCPARDNLSLYWLLTICQEVEMEEIWSAAMGRPIKVLPIDEESLDKVEKNFISTGHGPDWGRDIRLVSFPLPYFRIYIYG